MGSYGRTWAWAGSAKYAKPFWKFISYILVARSEPKIHTDPYETMPHPFPHALGGRGGWEGGWGRMWKGMGHGFNWICLDMGFGPDNKKI